MREYLDFDLDEFLDDEQRAETIYEAIADRYGVSEDVVREDYLDRIQSYNN